MCRRQVRLGDDDEEHADRSDQHGDPSSVVRDAMAVVVTVVGAGRKFTGLTPGTHVRRALLGAPAEVRRGSGGGTVQDRYSGRVRIYMWSVTALSVPLLVLVGRQAAEVGYQPLLGQLGVVVAMLSVVLVAGEMWPIPVSRGEESSDEITVSSTFGLALLLVAPVFFTILAQTVALVVDWWVRGRTWQSLLFNIAQYAFAFAGARAVYALAAQQPFTPTGASEPDLLAAVAAGAAFLVLNNGLVGMAVALRLRVSLWSVLTEDLSWQLMTSAPCSDSALSPLRRRSGHPCRSCCCSSRSSRCTAVA
jgi:hypothetical protein